MQNKISVARMSLNALDSIHVSNWWPVRNHIQTKILMIAASLLV